MIWKICKPHISFKVLLLSYHGAGSALQALGCGSLPSLRRGGADRAAPSFSSASRAPLPPPRRASAPPTLQRPLRRFRRGAAALPHGAYARWRPDALNGSARRGSALPAPPPPAGAEADGRVLSRRSVSSRRSPSLPGLWPARGSRRMMAFDPYPCLAMLVLILYLISWLTNPSSKASASTFFVSGKLDLGNLP